MRVLLYSHYFWPSTGGVETYTRLMAEGMAESKDLTVTVATESLGAEGVSKYKIIRRPGIFRLWNLISQTDVVFIAGPSLLPMIIGACLRKPFVIEHHGYQAICPNGLLLNKFRGEVCSQAFQKARYGECLRCVRVDLGSIKSVRQLLLTMCRRLVCWRAHSHIAVTEHVKSRHVFERMSTIYHGVQDTRGDHELVSLKPHNRIHFAYVGRLTGEKGLFLLLDAAQTLRVSGIEFSLSFIGDGELRLSLEDRVKVLGLGQVTKFTGFLHGRTLEAEVSTVDVVIMPSIWEETAGLSAIEQMMRGRVVLASDIGGLGEVVGDGGLKFRPFDAQDLAEKMELLAASEALRTEIGARARERAMLLFRLHRMVDEHVAVLRGVIQHETLESSKT